jgi:hypothetical protein
MEETFDLYVDDSKNKSKISIWCGEDLNLFSFDLPYRDFSNDEKVSQAESIGSFSFCENEYSVNFQRISSGVKGIVSIKSEVITNQQLNELLEEKISIIEN